MQKHCIDAKYSVFICVCSHDNKGSFLKAYESILNQTVAADEIVICADRVQGELLECVDSLTERCRVMHIDSEGDHASARRAAFDACTNELVAVMDADDVALPYRFERTLPYFETGTVDVVGGAIREFSKETSELLGLREVPLTDGEIKRYMKKRCPFNHMTVMYRKSAVEKSGGYLSMFCNEDYYLWVRMAQSGAVFANVDDILCHVGVSASSYERRGGRRFFESEKTIQKYMLSSGMIGRLRYYYNIFIRYVVQILMPPSVRKGFYNIFLRTKR